MQFRGPNLQQGDRVKCTEEQGLPELTRHVAVVLWLSLKLRGEIWKHYRGGKKAGLDERLALGDKLEGKSPKLLGEPKA